MKKLNLPKNPFLIFLPFLVLFFLIVLIYPTNGTFGDENRYLIYARYMVDGFLPSTNPGSIPWVTVQAIPYC